MKLPLVLLALLVFSLPVRAADFSRTTAFASVDAFVDAAVHFQPATGGSDLSSLFTVPELGQPEDPRTGQPITAPSLHPPIVLWSDTSLAVVFVTAQPPTQATISNVGVLFLLAHQSQGWRIQNIHRFVATGQDSGLSAKLTAFAGPGRHLGEEGLPPVVTIGTNQGGRGYAYQVSSSYVVEPTQFKLLNPESSPAAQPKPHP